MTDAPLHMIKLCVGAEGVDDLVTWQAGRSAERAARGLDPRPRHVTRMWPRRADEILAGGSLFWVFKGAVLARQPIEALEEVIGDDGIRRCAIALTPEIIRVEARPRRPFQGWRYLTAADAPPDLGTQADAGPDLPAPLAMALNDLGVVARP
ncbi:MAG: DUF1489 domain-containing protein [Pseudomonadota bacterium]